MADPLRGRQLRIPRRRRTPPRCADACSSTTPPASRPRWRWPSPARARPTQGVFRDTTGAFLDGDKTYKVTLPGPVPAKEFWSFVVYDNQTRSLLETDQKLAGVDSTAKDLKVGSDGSVTVYFGPKAPEGEEANWVQTMPGKGFNVLFRLYGPLEPWFDKSWKPGDLEVVQ